MLQLQHHVTQLMSLHPGTLTPTADGAFLCSSAQYDASNTAFTPEDEGWTFLVNDTAGGGSTYNASKAQDTIVSESCEFTLTGGDGLNYGQHQQLFCVISCATHRRYDYAGTFH